MTDKKFSIQINKYIKNISKNEKLYKSGIDWLVSATNEGYPYIFKWLGVPVIKLPADLIVLQEILVECKPDIIIETGVARGGSIIYLSSIMKIINPLSKVIGIEIDLRSHAKKDLKKFKDILNFEIIEGSSTSKSVFSKVKNLIPENSKVMVILDSDHTLNHTSKEINLYKEIVSKGQYLCITDTFIEDFPENYWEKDGVGNSPAAAIKKWDFKKDGFVLDFEKSRKAVISENKDAYFKKI